MSRCLALLALGRGQASRPPAEGKLAWKAASLLPPNPQPSHSATERFPVSDPLPSALTSRRQGLAGADRPLGYAGQRWRPREADPVPGEEQVAQRLPHGLPGLCHRYVPAQAPEGSDLNPDATAPRMRLPEPSPGATLTTGRARHTLVTVGVQSPPGATLAEQVTARLPVSPTPPGYREATSARGGGRTKASSLGGCE